MMKASILPLKRFSGSLGLGFLLVCGGVLSSHSQRAGRDSSVSREMEQAIRLYRDGRDNEAMDRFMDILAKGTPSERSLANDYLNRITHRMNTGETSEEKPEESAPRPQTAPVVLPSRPEPKPASEESVSPREAGPVQDDGEDEGSKSALMAKRIESKISGMRKSILAELSRQPGVQIYMEEELPQAVSIDPKVMFSGQINFRSGAQSLLAGLSGLMFTMGRSRLLLLPEGAVDGDIKIVDMRRAMALSSYFAQLGISPARIEVNLMGTQLNLPSRLHSMKGMAVFFEHDAEPNLKQPDSADDSSGPQISLGVYPPSISPADEDGALIEFSVLDPRSGSPTWRFQILRTDERNSSPVVQEVSGSEAAHHQIYWNGKKDFFGSAYPPGNYACVLTASDVQGRESVSRRAILLRSKTGAPAGGEQVQPAARPPAPAPRVNPRVSSPGGGGKTSSSRGKNARKLTAAGKREKIRAKSGKERNAEKISRSGASAKKEQLPANAAPADSPEAAPRAEQAEFGGQVSYRIMFQPGTTTLVSGGEKKIRQVADTMNYWPLAKLTLVGYSHSGEPNAQSVAQNRANIVASVLSDRYGVNRDRMQIQSKVDGIPQSMVEIKMVSRD